MRDALFILTALLMASCRSPTLQSDRPTADSVRVEVTPVPLDSQDASVRRIGSFTYAGGIEIHAAGSSEIHELSDLRIVADDHLIAVSDRASFFEARLLFDDAARLSGLTDPRVIPLVGEHGEPLAGTDADAEGLAVFPHGDRLVSFERHHRIWLYPADGSAPRPTPAPDAEFPDNGGMEALSLYPSSGPDAYLVGSEGGSIWLCRLSASCRETDLGALTPSGYGLTALAAYGVDGGFAMLARAYDPRRGNRISVRLIAATSDRSGRVLDEMTMAPPLTVDNFEGIAVVPRPPDGIRLYLVSDDNGSPTQRTYLLAFDWQPPRQR